MDVSKTTTQYLSVTCTPIMHVFIIDPGKYRANTVRLFMVFIKMLNYYEDSFLQLKTGIFHRDFGVKLGDPSYRRGLQR